MITDPVTLREVKRASEEFLSYLDDMDVKGAYEIASDEFREFSDLSRMKQYTEMFRNPMGKLASPRSVNSVWSMEFPAGNRVIQGVSIEYSSVFEQRPNVRETVWLLPASMGTYKVLAYNLY